MKSLMNAMLEVRLLPIEQLKPAPYNPRKTLQPGDAAYRKLEASLREFGLVEPLIWNERSGRVVGGHTRLMILKKLGVKKVPVSVVRLSQEREKALNIVLNNQEAQGRYDTEKLADLLEELEDLPELELTGFDQHTIDALRFEPAGAVEQAGDESDSVAVTLEMDAPTYEIVAPRLDEIVAEFDLISHVRRR
jgi:ParB-like nuclease family protein